MTGPQPATLGHGRWLIDVRPSMEWFGGCFTWTVEDLDSDADDLVVASGRSLDLASAKAETCTALLGPNGLARAGS